MKYMETKTRRQTFLLDSSMKELEDQISCIEVQVIASGLGCTTS